MANKAVEKDMLCPPSQSFNECFCERNHLCLHLWSIQHRHVEGQ